jgi:PAS domain S-box-containing protein
MNDTASSDVPDPSNLLAATPVEARYRALLRATSDLVFWTDAECILVGYHANVPEELALPPEAFLGRRVDEVLPAPAGETWKEALRRARESGCLQQFEYSLTFGDGERRYEARAFPSESSEVVTLVRNITARWKLAESLRQSEERYRTVVENQVELVSRFRPDSVLTFVNDAYCRYFHRSQDELIGMSFFEMIPEWVQGSARQSLADFIKDPGPVAWENEVFSGAGEVRWQQWNFAPILDGHGNVVEIQGVGRDCTDRRRAELELKRREVEFETLADNALDIITRHDAQMRYLYVNRALCESAQVPRAHFLGKTPRELGFSESAVDPFEEALKEVFSTRQFTSALISSPGRGERSGKDVYFHVHAVPEFSESGELISVLSIARDVTALRQAQKEVEEINRSLENRSGPRN